MLHGIAFSFSVFPYSLSNNLIPSFSASNGIIKGAGEIKLFFRHACLKLNAVSYFEVTNPTL
jgi:hypothetical protein